MVAESCLSDDDDDDDVSLNNFYPSSDGEYTLICQTDGDTSLTESREPEKDCLNETGKWRLIHSYWLGNHHAKCRYYKYFLPPFW